MANVKSRRAAPLQLKPLIVAYESLGTGKGFREHAGQELAVSVASVLADASIGDIRLSGHHMDRETVEIYFEGKYSACVIFRAK